MRFLVMLALTLVVIGAAKANYLDSDLASGECAV